MTHDEKIARGERAYHAREFLGPICDDLKAGYAARIVDVASKELNPRKRTEAITSLSVATRILDQIAAGLDAYVNDGEVAKRDKLKAESIEKMNREQRTILDIVPLRR